MPVGFACDEWMDKFKKEIESCLSSYNLVRIQKDNFSL